MVRLLIKQGELRGSVERSTENRKYYSFKGIPYAKPPVGDLRFRAPVPDEGWSGVREALEESNQCIQQTIVNNYVIEGDEDCLYLNVYTPKLGRPQLPVMVWIHGGAFLSGSNDSSVYGPQHLMDKDVVLVTINYRLEVLGFLNLDTEEVSGNAGMKDQVLSLKWVRDNISQFGGNPDNVTIFGESAGAASVSYHLVSPMSKGLFHRAILQSGSIFCEWAFCVNHVEYGYKIAKHHGRDFNNVKDLTKFLKTLPASKLVNMTESTYSDEDKNRALVLNYCPTIEKTFPGQEAFLPKSPLELMEEGNINKVPIMIGYTDKESLFNLAQFEKKKNHLENDFRLAVPRSIQRAASPELIQKLSKDLRTFYYGDKKIDEAPIDCSIDMESDLGFMYGVQKLAKRMVQISEHPVYFYLFRFEGDLNFVKIMMNNTHLKGASHGDEMMYVFKNYLETEEGSPSWITMKRMVKMLTNFAIHR